MQIFSNNNIAGKILIFLISAGVLFFSLHSLSHLSEDVLTEQAECNHDSENHDDIDDLCIQCTLSSVSFLMFTGNEFNYKIEFDSALTVSSIVNPESGYILFTSLRAPPVV